MKDSENHINKQTKSKTFNIPNTLKHFLNITVQLFVFPTANNLYCTLGVEFPGTYLGK